MLVVAGVVVLVGAPVLFIVTQEPWLGLDLAGGLRITLLADIESLDPDEHQDWEQGAAQEVIRILEERAQAGLGVQEATVFRKGEDRFVVELPGFTDEQDARDLLRSSGRVDFYWARTVTTFRDDGVTLLRQGRYDHLIITDADEEQVDVFYRRGSADPIVEKSAEWDRMIESWEKILDGEHLAKATPRLDPISSTGDHLINLQFDGEGTRIMGLWGRRVLNRNEWLVAIIDQEIITFARVMRGNLFSRGQSQLTGQFTAKEAKYTANLLNAGTIPVDLSIEDTSRVHPTIGKILFAGAIAFAVVVGVLYLLLGDRKK